MLRDCKSKRQNILPVDSVLAKEFSADAEIRIASITDIKDDEMSLDVGPDTVTLFTKELQGAKTVVWNGPMGVFEIDKFANGTLGVCEALANLGGAITIVGGEILPLQQSNTDMKRNLLIYQQVEEQV